MTKQNVKKQDIVGEVARSKHVYRQTEDGWLWLPVWQIDR